MLKDNHYYSPFLGDYVSLSEGLNPLGIRTASEQLFATLLPGLNVVTSRIRYYSFYCWLLKRFYLNRETTTAKELKQYIRKSELLMALIHANVNSSAGVPGITRALFLVRSCNDKIDYIKDAVPDETLKGGYWKGSSYGAFGSYYSASLQRDRGIGLIAPINIKDSVLYNITKKEQDHSYICGEDLANAFAESVGEMGNVFEECAANGIVTKKELTMMEDYFQCHNLRENSERQLLLDMLLQKDIPFSLEESYLRKDSIRLLLSYIDRTKPKNIFSELDFARYVYNIFKNQEEKSLAAAGWYDYYLNDSRQYESLNIFDIVLRRLQSSTKPGKWEKIDDFSSQLADETCAVLGAEQMTVGEMVENWDNINKPTEQMALAFYVLFDNYKMNLNYKDYRALIESRFSNVNDDALDAFDTLETHLDKPVNQYIKHFLSENIIYNHYSESMRKFSQNSIPTQKLTIENGYVRGLSTYTASHSSPRINTLKNYAVDLGLINEHNLTLTSNGYHLLYSLENEY